MKTSEAEFIVRLFEDTGVRCKLLHNIAFGGGKRLAASAVKVSDPLILVTLLADYCREATPEQLKDMPDFIGLRYEDTTHGKALL